MNRIAIKPNVMEQVFAVARRSALFAAVPDEYLEKMLCQSPQRLADGECVFQQGDKADRFYLVIEGQIKLQRLTASGAEHIVNIMGPGDTFGEAALFFRRPVFPVAAEAVKGALVCAIDGQTFSKCLEENPSLCLSMLGEVCVRLHARLNEVSQIRLKNAEHRLAWFLLDQVEDPQADTAVIHLQLAKKHLASRLSMMPETLSRAIARLHDLQLLNVDRDTFMLTDIPALRQAFALDS